MITPSNGMTLAFLESGRDVYLADCSRCHSVEPIDRYSAERWRDIIVRMAPKSKLDELRTDALQAYVLTAHAVLARNAAAKKVVRVTNDPGLSPDETKRRTQ